MLATFTVMVLHLLSIFFSGSDISFYLKEYLVAYPGFCLIYFLFSYIPRGQLFMVGASDTKLPAVVMTRGVAFILMAIGLLWFVSELSIEKNVDDIVGAFFPAFTFFMIGLNINRYTMIKWDKTNVL